LTVDIDLDPVEVTALLARQSSSSRYGMEGAAAPRYGPFWSAKSRNKRTQPRRLGAAITKVTIVIDNHGGFD
jgi:hypothetical protein